MNAADWMLVRLMRVLYPWTLLTLVVLEAGCLLTLAVLRAWVLVR